MSWSDLLAAVALYLVLEGVLPFLNPPAMKRVLMSMANFFRPAAAAVGAGEHGGRRAVALFCQALIESSEQDDES
jgi:uncharacterized protein YjeT (DUF2065 family)